MCVNSKIKSRNWKIHSLNSFEASSSIDLTRGPLLCLLPAAVLGKVLLKMDTDDSKWGFTYVELF